ncbi:MAG: DHH family phosphoesterase [Gammaproteobacteria bacterium]|nr:DHH family phosphoesterase [Gammaproteobacteria bacterium]
MHYDVFNGDADGICALIQLRLHQSLTSELITGVKRDIQLLSKISVKPGDSLTVLDISFSKNSKFVSEFLNAGAAIFYVDHHQIGDLIAHPKLTTRINTDSAQCTSLLINDYLGGKYPLWAITAAFGDNVTQSAERLAAKLSLGEDKTNALKKLGIYINYNGYGDSVADLHFPPATLYREMAGFASPFDFMLGNPEIYDRLAQGYSQDMTQAEAITPEYLTEAIAVYILPEETWARRVSGVFGNLLMNQDPSKAYAVLSRNSAEDYQVSVRAPANAKGGADDFCARFETGGGRKLAAGINRLPKEQLTDFINRFTDFFR